MCMLPGKGKQYNAVSRLRMTVYDAYESKGVYLCTMPIEAKESSLSVVGGGGHLNSGPSANRAHYCLLV